jgi:hypothetical protein
VAAALVAVLLQRSTGVSGVPAESAFVTIFVIGAVTAALALVLIGFSRSRGRSAETLEAREDSRAMNHEWG